MQGFDINKKITNYGRRFKFFNSKLDAQDEKRTIKKKSLPKLIELRGCNVLCDIWRVRNTKFLWFTLVQKYSSSFIQNRPDYMFILNTLQEFVTMTEMLTPISTNHSSVHFSLSNEKSCLRGKEFWKFNLIKKLTHSFCTANKSLFNHQLKWELSKYEVRKFTFNYTKQRTKITTNWKLRQKLKVF